MTDPDVNIQTLPLEQAGGYTATALTELGGRDTNEDHAACLSTGDGVSWAVADGVAHAQNIARDAVAAALPTAVSDGAAAGIRAARDRLLEVFPVEDRSAPDTCLIVATPSFTETGGIDLAWAGDCRAVALIDGEIELLTLTIDHNYGAYFNDLAHAAARLLAPEVRNVVTSTVRRGVISAAQLLPPFQRLLLTSDGIHDHVGRINTHRILSEHTDPAEALTALITQARENGSTDNATGLLIDPR